jgi:hypothetical protein
MDEEFFLRVAQDKAKIIRRIATDGWNEFEMVRGIGCITVGPGHGPGKGRNYLKNNKMNALKTPFTSKKYYLCTPCQNP